jgi:chromosome segregation ATPase
MSSSEGGTGDASAPAPGGNNPWESARDASSQMILQSALEDIENRAAKQQEELIHARQKAAELDAAWKSSLARAEELQGALQSKTEAYDKLQLEYQGASTKSMSLEERSKMDQERMDRLQVESDKLREEIR